jgi:hypothetical protein
MARAKSGYLRHRGVCRAGFYIFGSEPASFGIAYLQLNGLEWMADSFTAESAESAEVKLKLKSKTQDVKLIIFDI